MLSVIIKGTNGCNLACSYCSLGEKQDVKIVTEPQLTAIFRYICEVCRFRKEDCVRFILHGGEPTLIRAEVYEHAITNVREAYPDIRMEFSIQTNGFHITDEMLRFFVTYDVSVGISIDGSKQIHDAERKDSAGLPTYDRVLSNIGKLAARGIKTSCLMVLTSNAVKEDFSFLHYYEKKKLHLKINPLLNYGEVTGHPELSLRPGEYADYLIRLYQYILKEGLDVSVSPIDKILQGILLNSEIHECTFKDGCGQYLCIDYNGDIYPCGRYSDMAHFRLANIADRVLDLLHIEQMEILTARRSTRMPQKCKSCRYWNFCHAGCNAEASIDGSLNSVPALCLDYYELFSYFHGDGLLLFRKELVKWKERIKSGI